MSSRYITIPAPATFIDPGTKKRALIPKEGGGVTEMADRDHEWFVHVYILSHLQFNTEVGGVEAARSAREIGRSLDKALLDGLWYYEISEDALKRIKLTMARASDEDYEEARKEKPNPRVLANSTLGATRGMSNFEASCYMDHFDAFENASTKKPETPPSWWKDENPTASPEAAN
jgi:hypothetical protein